MFKPTNEKYKKKKIDVIIKKAKKNSLENHFLVFIVKYF